MFRIGMMFPDHQGESSGMGHRPLFRQGRYCLRLKPQRMGRDGSGTLVKSLPLDLDQRATHEFQRDIALRPRYSPRSSVRIGQPTSARTKPTTRFAPPSVVSRPLLREDRAHLHASLLILANSRLYLLAPPHSRQVAAISPRTFHSLARELPVQRHRQVIFSLHSVHLSRV